VNLNPVLGREKMRRNILLLISIIILLGLILGGAGSGFAWDEETWLKLPPYEWKSENPEIAGAWAEMMGFKAPDVVGKVAPEIKPGMIIDRTNYKDYPGLKELLTSTLYARLDPGSYASLAPLKIAKTSQYHYSKGCLEDSLKNLKTCKIGADGITMEGYHGGVPFPHPKTGLELAWVMDNKYIADNLYMNPMWIRLYGRDNRPQRDMKWYLGGVRYSYRCDLGEDVTPNPEGVNFGSSGWFFYPRDISGTCYLRRRFLDVEKPDEFLLYLPSMRRVRRMGGRDAQDPMFGSDLTWDDFQLFYQKISSVSFPMEWKLIGEKELLYPTEVHVNRLKGEERPPDSYVDESRDQTYLYWASWQRRPVYIVEGHELDKDYMYSKRVYYVDREILLINQDEFYDRSGRLWRTTVRDCTIDNVTGYFCENLLDVVDHPNYHRTFCDCKGIGNAPWIGPEYLEMKFLIRKAK